MVVIIDIIKLNFQTSNLKPQISNLKPQTSNLKPQTSNLKPQTPSHTLLTTFYLSAYLPLVSYNHKYGCYSLSTAQLYRVWHTT
ncbi:hypothetical protein MC79_009315 [Providencia stuartii]|nr:hypothetical protein MC79_009315 [Providencia stuartii]